MHALSTRFLKKQLGLWGSPGVRKSPQTDLSGERRNRRINLFNLLPGNTVHVETNIWEFESTLYSQTRISVVVLCIVPLFWNHDRVQLPLELCAEPSSNSLPLLARMKYYWPSFSPNTLAQIITGAILRGIPLFRYRWTINTADWAEMPKRRTCPGAVGEGWGTHPQKMKAWDHETILLSIFIFISFCPSFFKTGTTGCCACTVVHEAGGECGKQVSSL